MPGTGNKEVNKDHSSNHNCFYACSVILFLIPFLAYLSHTHIHPHKDIFIPISYTNSKAMIVLLNTR